MRLRQVALREAQRFLAADAAEDAAQEALLRAWRASASCRDADPAPWVRTIARREAFRIHTRARERPVGESVEPEDHPESLRDDTAVDLLEHLKRLSEPEQLALLLRYWADKTDSEIAAALDIPLGTVKIRIHRARHKLAVDMSARPPDS